MPRRLRRRRQQSWQPEIHFASHREARQADLLTRREFTRLDLYYRLLTIRWSLFFLLIGIIYILFNLVFAALYALQPGSIASARPGSLIDAFFFSVQTMATIGYGDMHPATLYANLVVTVEVLLGLVGFALGTGIIFARISRPTAQVMFSRRAVVTVHDGVPTLMFRAANQRRNRIVEAQVNLVLVRNEATAEGVAMRRFYDLAVARPRTPLFSLSWSVMHPIDAASPLHGATRESLLRSGAELIVTILGLDETLSQTVHARHVYAAADIEWNRRFADVIGRTPDGRLSVDYSRFHDTVAAEARSKPQES